MSCSMWAGTVTAPGVDTVAATSSITSRSRSVAFSDSLLLPARNRTFDRIGMVVRRSTTLVTCPSALKSSPRSITSRMIASVPQIQGVSFVAFSGCPLGDTTPGPTAKPNQTGPYKGRSMDSRRTRNLTRYGVVIQGPLWAAQHFYRGQSLSAFLRIAELCLVLLFGKPLHTLSGSTLNLVLLCGKPLHTLSGSTRGRLVQTKQERHRVMPLPPR